MPGGRPMKVHHMLRRDADGNPVTIADTIVQAVRIGAFIEDAASRAGVGKDTIYRWQREGARACERRERGERLDPDERRLAEFSDAVAKAQADAKVEGLVLLSQLANGELSRTRTIEKVNARGNVGERRTETERLVPDLRAITWRFEHLWPDQYRGRIEVTGADGAPLGTEAAATLAEKLEQALAAKRETVDDQEVSDDGDTTGPEA